MHRERLQRLHLSAAARTIVCVASASTQRRSDVERCSHCRRQVMQIVDVSPLVRFEGGANAWLQCVATRTGRDSP